jgi:uncharacterized protein YjiS (DUF1127 family)
MADSIARTAAQPRGLPHARRSLSRLSLWIDLWCERRALRALDARLLEDIGLDIGSAEREATRRPWDVPAARSDAA